MFKASTIVLYITTKCNYSNIRITDRHIQCILYCIQKDSLQRLGVPAFSDAIIACEDGPNIPFWLEESNLLAEYQSLLSSKEGSRFSTIINALRTLPPEELDAYMKVPGGAWEAVYDKGNGDGCVIPVLRILEEAKTYGAFSAPVPAPVPAFTKPAPYIRDLRDGERYREGIVRFPLFDKYIQVHIDFGVDPEYAELCAAALVNLSEPVIDSLCSATVKYCDEFRPLLSDIPVYIPEGISGRDILPFVSPIALIINEPKGSEPAFHLDFGCVWEPEHGLEWVIRGDNVLYVGSFDNEDPWCDTEYFRSVPWNYAKPD